MTAISEQPTKLSPDLKSAVCCFHQSMTLSGTPVTLTFELERDQFEVTALHCQDPECRTHYSPVRGYFGARLGEHPTFGTTGAPVCNRHGSGWYPMFLCGKATHWSAGVRLMDAPRNTMHRTIAIWIASLD